VAAAKQFAADSGAGFDIAASTIARQSEFHDYILSVIARVGDGIGHYLWLFNGGGL
jgi:hypothetical protein